MGEKTEWVFSGDATEMKKALEDIIKGLKDLKKEAVTTADGLEDVTKQNKKAATAAKGLSETTKGLSSQMSRLGHLIHSVAAPRSALSTMSNKMIEAAGAGGGLMTAVAGLHPAFLAAAGVAATLGAAYVLLTKHELHSAAAAKVNMKVREDLNKILIESEKRIVDYRISLAVLNGELTETEAANKRAGIAAQENFGGSIEKVEKTLKKASRQIIEIQERIASGNTKMSQVDLLGMTVEKGDIEKLRELEGAVNFLTNRKAQLKASMREEVTLQEEINIATEEAEKATKALAEANKPKKNTALKTTLATALQVEQAFQKIAEGALADIITEEGKLTQAFFNTSEQLTILETKTQKRIEDIDAQIEQAKELNLTEEQQLELFGARFVLETQLNQVGKTRFELNEQLIRQQEELAEQQEELAKSEWLKSLHEGLGAASSLATAFGDAFGASIDFIIGENENLSESQREVLMNLFNAQKAAAAGSIVISTAAAIMKALEELGPIAGAVSSAAIAITGGVQLATVLAQPPPFHTGGIVPSNGMVNALGGEAFLNRETTSRLGQEGVNALNSGEGVSGGAIQIQNVYGHRVFDRFVIDNISKGGPLSSAIQGGSRVGHSTRSTS